MNFPSSSGRFPCKFDGEAHTEKSLKRGLTFGRTGILLSLTVALDFFLFPF